MLMKINFKLLPEKNAPKDTGPMIIREPGPLQLPFYFINIIFNDFHYLYCCLNLGDI